MPYTTLDALVRRFGEATIVSLTDRAVPATGAIDAAVVDQAIADAGAVIDASLVVRYRLPLDSVPAFVADIALAISGYKLHPFAPEQKVKDDYDQALRDLRDLASGAKKLDVAGVEPAGSGSGGVLTSDRVPPLSVDSLRGFI